MMRWLCIQTQADVSYALGILYVRTGSHPAINQLCLIAPESLAADNPQFVYIYAVALAEVGRVEEAIAALELAQLDFPTMPK